MNKRLFKKTTMSVLIVSMLFGISTIDYKTSAIEANNGTVADWKFDENAADGNISDGSLIIIDQTENGNDLVMNVYDPNNTITDWSNYLEFSDESMDMTSGSMVFSGDNEHRTGADFITADDAPINDETFESGFTLEFMYKLPANWTTKDAWMGLMARQADPEIIADSMDEEQLGSLSLAISSCKELQVLAVPADNNHQMNSSAWSVTMDNGGAWYHIAIVSDNNIIRTFVNGNEAFRDYESTEMVGLYADSDDGRFRIGSSYWVEGTDTLDKFLHGNIQRVRISEGALEKSQWLISEPEQYAGEFGNNNDFALKNSKNYNMVFIPDTQNTIKFRPEVLETAIDELIESKKQYNLAGVIHLGDVTENYDDGSQYESARDIFNKLPENHIKLMIQPGNHDYGSFYDESFSRFSSSYMKLTNYYLKNDSPSGRSSYMFINAGSYRYMVVSLSYEDIEQDKAWLESVLNKNSKYPTILTSHDLQNASDSMPSAIKLSRTGKVVWEIIKNYNQVFMLLVVIATERGWKP